jgi:hypothetical protein
MPGKKKKEPEFSLIDHLLELEEAVADEAMAYDGEYEAFVKPALNNIAEGIGHLRSGLKTEARLERRYAQ